MVTEASLSEALRRAEYKIFVMATTDAVRLGEDGRTSAGHGCLLVGFLRAIGYASEGHPWAGELVAAYRDAIRQYGQQYQIAPAPEPDAPPGTALDARQDAPYVRLPESYEQALDEEEAEYDPPIFYGM